MRDRFKISPYTSSLAEKPEASILYPKAPFLHER
jgi:hypothetical protein